MNPIKKIALNIIIRCLGIANLYSARWLRTLDEPYDLWSHGDSRDFLVNTILIDLENLSLYRDRNQIEKTGYEMLQWAINECGKKDRSIAAIDLELGEIELFSHDLIDKIHSRIPAEYPDPPRLRIVRPKDKDT